MANRLAAINQLRAKINSQGVADIETLARRAAQNTTYHPIEIASILRLCLETAHQALADGETVKLDGLVYLSPNLKVGGEVNLRLRADRAALAALNNPLLWPAAKVSNAANLNKTAEQLVALWNATYPADPVTD